MIVPQSCGGISQTYTAGNTFFMPVGQAGHRANATESNVHTTYRTAGTLSNIYIRVATNATTASSTFRSRQNAANGGQSVTIGAGTTGAFEDTTNTDSVAAGDELALQMITGAGGNIAAIQTSTHFAATTDTASRLTFSGSISNSSNSTTEYRGVVGAAAPVSATEADVRLQVGVAGTLKNFFVNVSANGRATNVIYRSRKNAANGALSVTVGTLATGIFEDTANSDSLADTDEIAWSQTHDIGGGTITTEQVSAEFVSTASEMVLGSQKGSTNQNQNQTRNGAMAVAMYDLTDASVAEARTLIRASYTFSDLWVHVTANTLNVTDTTTFRDDGADTALSVAIGAATTGEFLDTDTVSVASGSLINYRSVIPAGTGSITKRGISVAIAAPAPAAGGSNQLMMVGAGT